jgi:taurine dioxygenase
MRPGPSRSWAGPELSALDKPPVSWSVRRLAGAIGAEIQGPQLADASAADIVHIQNLLLEHKVIFFPGQRCDVQQHIAFGRHFGHLEGHPNLSSDPDVPVEIFELRATAGGIADEWHTDLTFQEKPALLSILHMVTCPETGGDTMWSNLCAAYAGLSEPMQSLCDGLTALHDAHPHNHPEQTAIHPVVRVHPETGERALYVSEHFTRRIVEMNATESEVLLGYLTRWVKDPRFTVRYSWSPGTIAIWDNRCTQHCVVNDFEGERIIQRVTVVGDEVEGVAAPTWKPWLSPGGATATSRHDRQLYHHLKARKLLP